MSWNDWYTNIDAAYCITCGNPIRRRDGIAPMECYDCSRGLVPDRVKTAMPPSKQYLEALRQSRIDSGLCAECGTQPNGDALTEGLCRACVLAQSGHPDAEVMAHTSRLIAAKRNA